ncbi:DUF3152 domain-containing protein [Streptomyces sp. b94]|uniref:DUF3152 domain-containing protein n=1 Tax=Streptomyces sp. b94 TaxID=1827634 RepID=UPI001B373E7B|nr:DUF3152 domain-containing protein [Streptomyces sp. b94]MBQ1096911.1 DUF3152 domain-containing protein [Streptomyces sp. b94]
MGRHSRRGPAPRADTEGTAAAREGRPGLLGRRRAQGPPAEDQAPPANGTSPRGYAGPGQRLPDGTPAHGFPAVSGGTPGRGFPPASDGTSAREFPPVSGGTSARGFPPVSGGTPGRGFPVGSDGTPAHGSPKVGDGTPAHGFPRVADGAPARGVPGAPNGTPAHGAPRVRGGHPEQREPGGGWGDVNGRAGAGPGTPAGSPPGAYSPPSNPARSSRPGPPGPSARPPGPPFPRQRQAAPGGPRQDYLDAFGGDDDVFVPRARRPDPASVQPADPFASVTDWSAGGGDGGVTGSADDAPPAGEPAPVKGGKGRTFTGIAAAAVTTVLAVVVAGQVADGVDGDGARSQSATDQARDVHDSASRAEGRPTPSAPESAAPLTYEHKMEKRYPLGAELDGSGEFDAIPGIDKGPGTGQKYTYRVDVEQGLGLDGALFAEAVHKTLNDDRSWAHNGARSFERIHSGQPDFVITLASPGTTADWCAKSGLDTTEDNVSCDSAATERVMINAYRWAQGAEPYGDDIHGYRQMLINHEIGHRIGFNHVTCDKDGELAPVMQQQTKFVDHDGIDCRPNPWAYPNS